MKAAFIGISSTLFSVYSSEQRNELAASAGVDPYLVLTKEEILKNPSRTADTEFLFSTWGIPVFSEEELKRCFPVLKAVFYAAGSVQDFARPLLKRGVRVFSAWAANAVPVAEYAVSQILLANKGFFAVSRLIQTKGYESARNAFGKFPGNYGCRVGILGAGMIGSLVLEMLKGRNLDLLVFDPFLSDERAALLGARRAELLEIFSTCQTISNHLANNEQTVGILNGSLFSQMRENATFINTGRGAQVVETDLCDALAQRPLATAVLDVTSPEPSPPDHRFFMMPNVVLTPHIAGSAGDEVHRMAGYMLEEYHAFRVGNAVRYEVTNEMLSTMA